MNCLNRGSVVAVTKTTNPTTQKLNCFFSRSSKDRILTLPAGANFTDSRNDTAWTARFSAFHKYRPAPTICPPTEFSPV